MPLSILILLAAGLLLFFWAVSMMKVAINARSADQSFALGLCAMIMGAAAMYMWFWAVQISIDFKVAL